jgi:hypothetical protein
MDSAPSTDWQTWAAIGVVVLTVLVMVWRIVKRSRKKSGGCGKCGPGDCH